VRVSDILAHYRELYRPASQSPLIGGGDPMFGTHQNIGAIGEGTDVDPSDRFGTLMPGPVGGPPPLPDAGVGTGTPDGGGSTGRPDASVVTGPADAGSPAPVDAGTSSGASGGCSCRSGGTTTTAESCVWASLLGLAALGRARKRS